MSEKSSIFGRRLAPLPPQIPRTNVRTVVQTTIFLAKNTAYASIDDIFSLKILQIWKICSIFAANY